MAAVLLAVAAAPGGGCYDPAQVEQIGPIDVGSFNMSHAFDCRVPLASEVRYENWSANAADLEAPFDPTRPTIVLIHGTNLHAFYLGCGAYVWPGRLARALQPAVGSTANILVFNFDAVAATDPSTVGARMEGLAWELGAFLEENGLEHDLQVISHSGGSALAHELIHALGYVEQVTFLEFAPQTREKLVLEWDEILMRVGYLENYWVPGPMGIGEDLPPAAKVTNVLLLSDYHNVPHLLKHFVPVTWYQETIGREDIVGGFGWSLAGGTWECAGLDVIEYQGFMFARPKDGSMSQLTDDQHPAAQGLREAAAAGRLSVETAAEIGRELGLTFLEP